MQLSPRSSHAVFHHVLTKDAMSSYMQTTTDVPMHVRSDNSSSERRISPSWSIAQFKTRLEPITGIPSSSQRLLLRVTASQPDVPIEAANEEAVQLSSYSLQPYAEIHVSDNNSITRSCFNFMSLENVTLHHLSIAFA